ncbi:uracil-DNA glycosylase [Sphingomonas sp. ABOLG]|jgi:uracil-DNA glycosylase family 4|uniref:uracil-DNA glycosylase n=1 Tax=unclassified Sphingomonas TaxID=196159 RepID=UPI0006222E3E|nr:MULTISPECIES: uracil-DNA glycosylase [unclassified Sphingomonas]KKI18068.1 uracil-DNA glycosylase [Sphingomonas sp. Ag1]RSV19367.1 uracil-DNA glycosylase [Sphingomonas sp. ABOLG]
MDHAPSALPATEPPHDCPLCPRLAAFRDALRSEYPGWWNAPVPAFGDPDAWLVIVGLAPGKHGANRTGRPFTGDYAGELLYATLAKYGLSEGTFEARPDDGLQLRGAMLVNAVRCLPPENKPTPEEIRTCRPFLEAPIAALPKAKVFVALGQIAHQSTVKALGGRLPKAKFGHLAEHRMPDGRLLIDSYHCSRYNQNTGRLTAPMFEAVFERALACRDG